MNAAIRSKTENWKNHLPVELDTFIGLIEKHLGKKAIRRNMPMQPGDVLSTCADVEDLRRDVGFAPNTPLDVGIGRFVEWYRSYYRI